MIAYDLEESRVREFIKNAGAKRVGVQLPAGLKAYWREIRGTVEECGAEAVLVGSSCYGACDLADDLAIAAGCEALLHYGHSSMGLPSRLPVLYVEARVLLDPSPAVEEALPSLKFRKVGLTTTVQHIGWLQKIRELLLSRGYEPYVGRPERARYAGQVLGCDVESATSISDQVEGFLHVGTGEFHPLAVAAVTQKEVLAVSPFGGSRTISCEEFLRWRRGVIAKSLSCQEFGILLSTKSGQWRPEVAKRVGEKLRGSGRKVCLIIQDEIRVEELEDYGFEAYVCTACPRLALDDARRVRFPILTPSEVDAMLGAGLKPDSLINLEG
ncbi:MAG: diphthamide biosynthesis enzyme Dph2 [Candidatus Hadarchaeales archaeon]